MKKRNETKSVGVSLRQTAYSNMSYEDGRFTALVISGCAASSSSINHIATHQPPSSSRLVILLYQCIYSPCMGWKMNCCLISVLMSITAGIITSGMGVGEVLYIRAYLDIYPY